MLKLVLDFSCLASSWEWLSREVPDGFFALEAQQIAAFRFFAGIPHDFYCPSLCKARSLLSPGDRLHVRRSVTFVYCINNTAEDIVKLLSSPSSPIILVFYPRRPVPNSKNFSGGAKYTGVGRICDFQLASPFIAETVRALLRRSV